MPPHLHARPPPGMMHARHYMAPPMDPPPVMWPAQAMLRPSVSQPKQAGAPGEPLAPHQQYAWQHDPHWQQFMPAQRHALSSMQAIPGMQHSTADSPATSRSGGLSSQHSTEYLPRRYSLDSIPDARMLSSRILDIAMSEKDIVTLNLAIFAQPSQEMFLHRIFTAPPWPAHRMCSLIHARLMIALCRQHVLWLQPPASFWRKQRRPDFSQRLPPASESTFPKPVIGVRMLARV